MAQSFDLFGDPIPEGWGRRGRPQHIATQENRNKVTMLLALGWNNERIAKAVGITPPTLRRNYFRELKFRDEHRDRLDASFAMRLWREVCAGNAGAMRLWEQFIEKNDAMVGHKAFYREQRESEEARAPKPLGKKEQQAADAETAGQDTGWGDDLRPRSH